MTEAASLSNEDLAEIRAMEESHPRYALDRDWDRLEQLGTELRDDPAAPEGRQRTGAYGLVSAQMARGRIAAGHRGFEEIRDAALADGDSEAALAAFRAQILVSWFTGGDAPAAPAADLWDTTAVALYTHALWSATAGDTTAARRSLGLLTERPDEDVIRYGEIPDFLEAAIAAQGERWDEVVERLGPSAARGYDVGRLEISTSRIARQWLVSEAYERLDRPDSAAAFFERVLVPQGSRGEIRSSGRRYSLTHRRLALLYTQLEQLDRAEEHWLEFLNTFTEPDPEFQFMVDEGRTELERLARGR